MSDEPPDPLPGEPDLSGQPSSNPNIYFSDSLRRLIRETARTQQLFRKAGMSHGLLQQIAKAQDALRHMRTVAPGLEQLRRQVEANRKAIIEPALRAAGLVAEQMRQALPENWRDLDSDQFRRALKLSETGHVAIVWAPRTEIVVRLIDAGSQTSREQILTTCRGEILDDATRIIDDAGVSLLAAHDEARDQAREALEAARAGFDRAAQTLLASALGRVLEGALGFARPGAAYKQFKTRSLDDVLMYEMRLACLELATVNALTDTDAGPDGFNRHGTQHGSPPHLTEASMLGAALLVVGWVRELSWLMEHRPELFQTGGPGPSGSGQ